MPAATKIRPVPLEIRERLTKLVLLLGSSHDGERANAAAAIERTLKAAGLDMHDLAGALTTPTSPAPSPPPQQPPRRSSWPDEDDTESIPGDVLRDLIKALRAQRRFNARSEGFLDSMLARANSYRTVFVSPKQWQWLQDLARQAGLV